MPAAGRLARSYIGFMGVYVGQLGFSGHWMMAIVMMALMGWTLVAIRRISPPGPGAPRRLLMAADGRLHVATVGGAVEPVELAGESLWLGPAVLLVLRADGRRHRLLLGRGNLDPPAVANLRRRLRGAAIASVDPAVDSLSISGKGVSVVELLTRGISTRGP